MAPNINNIRIAKTVTLTGGDFLSVVHEPKSDRLWLGHIDFGIYTVDFTADKPSAERVLTGHTSYVSSLALLGDTLVSASWDRTLRWWDIRERKSIRSVDAHQAWVRQIAVDPKGLLLASVSDDMTCSLWEATTGKPLHTLSGFEKRLPRYDYPNKLYACALTPDGKHVAAADELCRVIVWETATGREAARFEAADFFKADWDRNNHPYGGIRRLAFSPDGKKLAIAGMANSDVAIINGKGLVEMFDWQKGEKTYELKLNDNAQYECLAFHPAGEWLLAAVGGTPGDPTAKIVFLDPAKPHVLKDTLATMPTYAFALSEDASTLYTAGRNKVLKWEFPA